MRTSTINQSGIVAFYNLSVQSHYKTDVQYLVLITNLQMPQVQQLIYR